MPQFDLLRRAAQEITALFTLLALHHAQAFQVQQDEFQELLRDAFVLRQRRNHHGFTRSFPGEGDHGFVPMVINMAQEKGESAYIGEGSNRWPAVHRSDAAALYRLIIEKQPELRVFHAVDEEGIAFREIAEAIGQGLNLPVLSKAGDEAAAHFGWFLHFASMDCPSSSEKTRAALNWEPKATGLITDIGAAGYLKK